MQSSDICNALWSPPTEHEWRHEITEAFSKWMFSHVWQLMPVDFKGSEYDYWSQCVNQVKEGMFSASIEEMHIHWKADCITLWREFCKYS